MATILLVVPGVTAAIRFEPVDEKYVAGYLGWRDGRGVIDWVEGATTEDPYDTGAKVRYAVDEFTSTPTPRTMYLNASRLVQADLYWVGSEAVRLDVEIWMGPRLLAGAEDFYQNSVSFCDNPKICANPSEAPPQPPGYFLGMYRMPAEFDEIPRGSIITVRAIHMDEVSHPWGLSGVHGSKIRFPVFAPEEILYRVPKYVDGGRQGSAVTQGGGSGLLPELPGPLPTLPIAAALPGLALARRRRTWQGLVVALVITASMGGCLGHRGAPPGGAGPSEDLGGSATAYLVPDGGNETGLANATRGSLNGIVLTPEGGPVGGAFVAILATAYSQSTDPYGRFSFAGLMPGTYNVRIDKTGFLPLEATARILAANITKLEVTLRYAEHRDADKRPHRHDYWFGGNGEPVGSLVIYEADTYHFVIPPPMRVLPGTVEIEINVTFPASDPPSTQAVKYQAHDPRDPENNITPLYKRPAGTSFHLRTTWENTDTGHATYSNWGQFFGSGSSNGAHVKVTLHKGPLPLEPPHPDHWKSSTEVTVVANETQPLKAACPGTGYTCPIGSYGAIPTVTTDRAWNASWRPTRFVPFETSNLEVRVKASRHLVAGETESPWVLFYHDAATPNYGGCDPIVANHDIIFAGHSRRFNSQRAELAHSDSDALEWRFKITLRPLSADPPYAPRTNWCFFVAPTDENSASADYVSGARGNNPLWTPVMFTLEVLALRAA